MICQLLLARLATLAGADQNEDEEEDCMGLFVGELDRGALGGLDLALRAARAD
jgi:hypothetical protein